MCRGIGLFDCPKNALFYSKGHLFVSVGQRSKKAKRLRAQAYGLPNRTKERS